jgi:hypothetical protein
VSVKKYIEHYEANRGKTGKKKSKSKVNSRAS